MLGAGWRVLVAERFPFPDQFDAFAPQGLGIGRFRRVSWRGDSPPAWSGRNVWGSARKSVSQDMSDAETTIDWAEQIENICRRFDAALRAGETMDGIEAWVNQVPETLRPSLLERLERCRSEIGAESVETRVVSSDAVLGHAPSIEVSRGLLNSASAVSECETFQGLSAEARRALEERFTEVSFPIGSQILRQGEQARGLHLVLRGFVDIIDTETGERIDCDGAGSVLGEMSLLMEQPCSADVIATSDVEALVLSNEAYHELKSLHPELEIALSQLVSDRLGGRRHDALCGKTIGGYMLNRCVNRGGMGVVYEATCPESDDRVALKMLRHGFIYDNQMQSRFAQEAKLLGELQHPNIVSLRDNFLAYRTRFLVLDLCDGADLYQVIRARGPLAESTVRALVGQIAKGLRHAHCSGVIHRDLKPGNVLVDRSGEVRLTDFGLSKLLKAEVSGGKAVGTPSYMPPEQFRTDDVGPACDWYALGCLICEMLTGRILFEPGPWRELFDTKRRKIPDETWPNVPASKELQRIIVGCLHPDPYRRALDLEALEPWAQRVDRLFKPVVEGD